MNLLQGSIAFALALAGFATLCTVLIEVVHRAHSLRAKGLRTMLHAYFDGVVQPRLEAAKAQADAAVEADFIDVLTANALEARLVQNSHIPKLWRRSLLRLDSLSTKDFTTRVQNTQAFAALTAPAPAAQAPAAQPAAVPAAAPATDSAAAPAAAPANPAATPAPSPNQTLLDDLAAQYDAYGQAATTYFKDRAHFLSLIVGIVLAFGGNIHSGRIFDAFVKNPDLAAKMEAQASIIVAAVESKDPGADKSVGQNLADVHNTLKGYQDMGLPVGWSYYPNCFGDAGADPRCAKVLSVKNNAPAGDLCLPSSIWQTAKNDGLAFLQWLVVVLITGLLIGLGGPFWYDLAVKLSAVAALLNGKAPLPGRTGQDEAAGNKPAN